MTSTEIKNALVLANLNTVFPDHQVSTDGTALIGVKLNQGEVAVVTSRGGRKATESERVQSSDGLVTVVSTFSGLGENDDGFVNVNVYKDGNLLRSAGLSVLRVEPVSQPTPAPEPPPVTPPTSGAKAALQIILGDINTIKAKLETLIGMLPLVVLLIGLGLSSGCSTFRRPPEQVAATLAMDAEDLAYAGCAYAISADPDSLSVFADAEVALNRLAVMEQLTPADIVTVLSPVFSRIKELRGPRGALIIAGARVILRQSTGDTAVEVPLYLRAIAGGVAKGFHQAMN
jgi:hypothetical protein